MMGLIVPVAGITGRGATGGTQSIVLWWASGGGEAAGVKVVVKLVDLHVNFEVLVKIVQGMKVENRVAWLLVGMA